MYPVPTYIYTLCTIVELEINYCMNETTQASNNFKL